MSTDFIPGALDARITFLTTFAGAITANPVQFGLVAADASSMTAALTALNAAKAAAVQASADSITATGVQLKASEAAAEIARQLVKKINGHPGVDNALRKKAGLPEHDLVRTALTAPTTKPIGRLEITGHFTLTLHFVDEMTPLRTAKPHGMHGCQIWSFVGTAAPADPTGYSYMATDTRTPYVDTHPAADAGKSVFYLLRWINTKGDEGPWSDVVTAKIPV